MSADLIKRAITKLQMATDDVTIYRDTWETVGFMPCGSLLPEVNRFVQAMNPHAAQVLVRLLQSWDGVDIPRSAAMVEDYRYAVELARAVLGEVTS